VLPCRRRASICLLPRFVADRCIVYIPCRGVPRALSYSAMMWCAGLVPGVHARLYHAPGAAKACACAAVARVAGTEGSDLCPVTCVSDQSQARRSLARCLQGSALHLHGAACSQRQLTVGAAGTSGEYRGAWDLWPLAAQHLPEVLLRASCRSAHFRVLCGNTTDLKLQFAVLRGQFLDPRSLCAHPLRAIFGCGSAAWSRTEASAEPIRPHQALRGCVRNG
jgi:hypothetical protein